MHQLIQIFLKVVVMTSVANDRELNEREVDAVSGGGIDIPTVDLPWPNGPILTGTGPYGGNPQQGTTR